MKSLVPVYTDWFHDLTGFTESSYGDSKRDIAEVYENLIFNPYEGTITSRVTGRKLQYGAFESPNMLELIQRVEGSAGQFGDCKVSTIVGDVTTLHCDPNNANKVFQVASQFNALEMVSPKIAPSDGITDYANDLTQGPACAMACGAGTLYRNYYLQTDETQLNMAEDMLNMCSTSDDNGWRYVNGYLFLTSDMIGSLELESYNYIRVGIQRDTEVTLFGLGHNVTQVFCSALPIAYYEELSDDSLHDVAQYILESAYRSTLAVAMDNNHQRGIPEVYLTLLGAGAFGNRIENIINSIVNVVLPIVDGNGLDIKIVCYTSNIKNNVDALLNESILQRYLT